MACLNGQFLLHHYTTHHNNIETLTRGVLERIFYVKSPDGGYMEAPTPVRGIFNTCNRYRNKVLKAMRTSTPMTSQQFVDSYTGARRKGYQDAREQYELGQLQPKHSYVSTFIKADKLSLLDKPDPVPRLIQPRHKLYNFAVGRYMKPFEHNLYPAIDQVFMEQFDCRGVTVFKGYNCVDQGHEIFKKWSRFNDPVFITTDASRYDQHVSVAALKYEHSYYNNHYRSKELECLLRQQLRNKGFCRTHDGFLKYVVNGKRCSGDMNTGCGNIIVMTAMMFTYFMHLGLTEVELVNNGDDSVIICERKGS